MFRKSSNNLREYWQEKIVPWFSGLFQTRKRNRRMRPLFFVLPLVLAGVGLWWLVRQPRVKTALKEASDDWDRYQTPPTPPMERPASTGQTQTQEHNVYSESPQWAADVSTRETVATTEETQDETPQADNLTDIEGISPITAGVLWDADIHTFQELAETDVKRLEEILSKADIIDVDPSAWPEQARLRMQGDQAGSAASSEELEAERGES